MVIIRFHFLTGYGMDKRPNILIYGLDQLGVIFIRLGCRCFLDGSCSVAEQINNCIFEE